MKAVNKSGKVFNIDTSKEIARGGEGYIVEVDKRTVAKIYLPGISPINETKFNYLTKLDNNYYIKPDDLLYDSNKVIGYIMGFLDKEFFPLYSAFSQNFCQRNNLSSSWKIDVATAMIKAIKDAHIKDIVIGDLSGFNTMANMDHPMFIDTDSYEVPGIPHSGRLLNDVRDYQKNGKISKEGDYFSSAVVIFNLLTSVHPFKGVHSDIGSLADRMIYKKPIFINDPKLTAPKCYKPITDTYLLDQFTKIFVNGDRFPLELNKKIAIAKTIKTLVYNSTDMYITMICEHQNIKRIKSSTNFLTVETTDKMFIYDTSVKMHPKLIYSLLMCNFHDVMVTDTDIFYFDKKTINRLDLNSKQWKEVKGIELKTNIIACQQYQNLFIIITEDTMYQVHLNQIMNNTLHVTTMKVFGNSFRNYQGLIQNVSGNSMIFVENFNAPKPILNTFRYDKNLEDVSQKCEVGICKYIENGKEVNEMFYIENLKKMATKIVPRMCSFDFNVAYIAYPEDDKLVLMRHKDLITIAEFSCNLIDEDSQVFITQAGIVLETDGKIYLMNKK
jgi:hypothetical protein